MLVYQRVDLLLVDLLDLLLPIIFPYQSTFLANLRSTIVPIIWLRNPNHQLVGGLSRLSRYNPTIYPLITNITMENHHFLWVNPLFHTISMAIFNSKLLVITRGYSVSLGIPIVTNWCRIYSSTLMVEEFLNMGDFHSLTKAQMQAHAAIFTRSAARVTKEIGSRALEPMVAMGWQKVNSCTGHSMIHTLTFTGNVFFDLLFPNDALW